MDTQLQLSNFLRNQGFAATRPGHHTPARAQESILSQACEGDARVAILETVFVSTVLHLGRLMGIPPVTKDRTPEVRWIRSFDSPFSELGTGTKSFFKIGLRIVRCPKLRTCPQCLPVALRERSRAKDAGDAIGEERAWKAFFIP